MPSGRAGEGAMSKAETTRNSMTLRADGAAMGAIRDFIAAFAAANRFSDDDRARVLIVVEEHVTNIVKYGYPAGAQPGSIEINLALEGDQLTIGIADDGQEFDPFNQPGPDLDESLEDRPIGRLGLHIIKSLTDEARYDRVGNRNVVKLVRRVACAPN